MGVKQAQLHIRTQAGPEAAQGVQSKQAGILVKKLASKQGVAGSIPTASKNINHSNFPAQKSVCTSSNHFCHLLHKNVPSAKSTLSSRSKFFGYPWVL